MLAETHDTEEIIERVAALDIGKAEAVCCARVPREGNTGSAPAGGWHLADHDPVPAGAVGPPALPGRDPSGHGSHLRLRAM